jgi:peptide/nickel transport system substrate-binding protein
MRRITKWVGGAIAVGAVFGFAGFAAADELIVGHSSLPAGLGNPLLDTSHSGGFVFGTVYDRLTTSDKNGPQPSLALSWQVNETDRTKWTMKLRPGVKFHNGDAFNAEDVAGLLTWLASDEGRAKAAGIARNLRNFAGARVIDEMTVEVSSKTPDPLLPAILGVIKILDWQHTQDVGFENVGTNPNGTGPYRSLSWTNDAVEVGRFADAWRPGQIDKVTFRFVPDVSARVAAFESDQIDLAFQLVGDNRAAVEASGGKLVVSPGTATSILHFFSNAEGPVADARVRQALNYGANMQAFVDTVMGGLTATTGQPGTPSINGYQADIKPYPYDPDKARALLAEAGYADGLEIIADSVTAQGDWRDIVQHVSGQLARIGVKMTVREITLPELIGRVRDSSKFGESRMFSFNYGSEPTMDIMRSINGLHSCNSLPKWTCFPEIEDTITAANGEFDTVKRAALLRKIAQFYHDTAASLFLFDSVDMDAVKDYVKDYRPVNRIINWHEVRMDRSS